MGMPRSSSITSHESSNYRRAASASLSAGTEDLFANPRSHLVQKAQQIVTKNKQTNKQALKHVRHVRTKDQC